MIFHIRLDGELHVVTCALNDLYHYVMKDNKTKYII